MAPGLPQPYAPGGSPGPVGGERARFGIRLGSYLLDALLYGMLSLVFVIPGGIMIGLAYDDCVSFDDELYCPPGSPNVGMIVGGIILIIVGVLVVFGIYVRAIAKTGQTWGCKIVGIKIVGEMTGEPIGTGKALGRTVFAGFISANVFYLGYLWLIWDDKRQTWHDKVVDSVVIKV